ncbi:hypothetical protein RRG08_029984 [Elysia crispata]|uniref:Reverse transcriptase domain-containing protein n=1 Tax=Elysia crispata TaxID=231223 RepID=A0AAE0ZJZ7_9GAST|nr:hypothetical protein RRG08_029984 [Elysia crispata]
MAEASFRLPPPLKMSEDNLADQFRKWKSQLEIYLEASGTNNKPPKTQSAIILHCAGAEAIEVFEQIDFADGEDRSDPTQVLGKLQQYCSPRNNEVLERYRFWNLPFCTPFDKFATELKAQSEKCNFLEKDMMIRDKIIFAVPKHLKERLLREPEITLKRTIDICQAYEQTANNLKEMKQEDKIEKVMKTGFKKPTGKPFRQYEGTRRFNTRPGSANKDRECRYCGKKHTFNKEECPAWGKTCNHCGGKNHFKIKCKKIHCLTEEMDSDNEAWLNAIGDGKKRATACLKVNNCEVRFQLDTAADVNTIQQRFVKKEQVTKSDQTLVMWNGTKMRPLGETKLQVLNEKTGQTLPVKFTVVKNNLNCLLSLTTCQDLSLVTINHEKLIAQTTEEPGTLGTASLKVDPDIKPQILPCRKVPFALEKKVEEELNSLMNRGILQRVTEPSDWVSQMAIVEKKNGSLRICIDPRPLNKALKREHYKLPTLDDVLPKFREAKIFTKLDVKEAFWHIKLDEEASMLTTMITPFGRVRWTRLPFGLNVSSEIFQRHLTTAIDDLPGIVNVADDLLVIGNGSTDEEAQRDHDRKYKLLKMRCSEKGIKLNQDKAREKQKEVIFMGHKISDKGIEPDEQKVEAIKKMQTPKDVHDVRRFCGMVQYLAKFLDKLSDRLQPLRELTKKDTQFSWSSECETAFNEIKNLIAKTPVLRFYDPNKPLEVQVDSSKDGLGACLMQDGQPIEFASRTLTETEQRWAQIEKEMLAVVFGLERFDQYTFGRKIFVTTDHKPLETIIRKPLSEAPRRLQRLIMRSNRYAFELTWAKGSSLLIADTLSRAAICNIASSEPGLTKETETKERSNIPDAMLEKLRAQTSEDDDMQVLIDIIKRGWPEEKSELPPSARPYFDFATQ